MAFDDSNIHWFPLGELEHFQVWIYDVDHDRQTVDFIIKFDPNQQIVLHNHTAHTVTFVAGGEHRIYEPDGSLKEVRPVGSVTTGIPSAPHREGAGDVPAYVYYSIRGEKGGSMFQLMNDDGSIATVLGIDDFAAIAAEHRAAITKAA